MGASRLILDEVDSTQDWLSSRWAAHPEWPHGFLVAAHHQWAGRGQAGRSWQAAAGLNFTGSLLLREGRVPAERPFQLNKAAALAVRDACARLTGQSLSLQVKWPNDVLAQGRKLAGILLQLVWKGQHLAATILGIGVNVNQHDFPPELRATSLSLLAGVQFDLNDVIDVLCRCLDHRMRQIAAAPDQLDADYLANLYRYQEWAQYRYQNRVLTAGIVGVDARGCLVLESDQGLLRVQPCQIDYL